MPVSYTHLKAKTINKYLGNDYVVKSSVGHIRDLPTSGSASKKSADSTATKGAKTVSYTHLDVYKRQGL